MEVVAQKLLEGAGDLVDPQLRFNAISEKIRTKVCVLVLQTWKASKQHKSSFQDQEATPHTG